jgi:hypothetical protein
MARRIGAFMQWVGRLVGKNGEPAVIPVIERTAAKKQEIPAHDQPLDRAQSIRHYKQQETVKSWPQPKDFSIYRPCIHLFIGLS